jgi:hypothetical protein
VKQKVISVTKQCACGIVHTLNVPCTDDGEPLERETALYCYKCGDELVRRKEIDSMPSEQTIDVETIATGGTYTIKAFGETSEPIKHGASPQEVDGVLNELARKAKERANL